mgnify:CR=1 FL=1
MSFKLFTRTYATSDKPDKAIIAIHGWKGDEYVFEQVAKLIKLENSEWFFPRAPYKSESGAGFTWFHGSDKIGWEYEKTISGLTDLFIKIKSSGFLH